MKYDGFCPLYQKVHSQYFEQYGIYQHLCRLKLEVWKWSKKYMEVLTDTWTIFLKCEKNRIKLLLVLVLSLYMELLGSFCRIFVGTLFVLIQFISRLDRAVDFELFIKNICNWK